MAQVLIIDDHDSIRDGLELLLRKRGHRTFSADGGERGLEILAEEGADLVITDLKMARVDGMEVLKRVRERSPDSEVLVITAYGTIETAVEAMRMGAVDFITKPFSSEEFGVKVDRILSTRSERVALQGESRGASDGVPDVEEEVAAGAAEAHYGEMVGDSSPMRDIFKLVQRVARSDSTVMIYGESGTGKELVARAIHRSSPRAEGPFVRVNCGALPETLLDSELFGHEKGAFTGAERQRRGRFELADGGTLFLDEISTIPPNTQVRLLRVLQEREIERVGGEETVPVDVRIIVATNTPEDALIARDEFRSDLFYRLHVVPMTLPPLRERGSDVPLLVGHFVEKLRERTRAQVHEVSEAAMSRLTAYHWPGNVRELENVIERALVLAEGEVLEAGDIPLFHAGVVPSAGGTELPDAGLDLTEAVETMEERLLRAALDRANGVKAEAARLLGLKSSAFYYKLEKYGIEG
jgi:two-component system, NtrC family, response regulator HydG